MNIQNSINQDRLEKLLLRLNLSPNNLNIARDYLLAERPDESLLAQAEPANFRLIGMETRMLATEFLRPLRESGKKEILARFYKLFWAMGKSTACYLLNDRIQDDHEWRVRILGKAAVAAMNAERITLSNVKSAEARQLAELAQTDPHTLLYAQTLCGDPIEGRMKVVLAGMLLCCADLEPEILREQSDLVLASILSAMPIVMSGIPPKDRDLLASYILDGDPSAPLPTLSGNGFYSKGYSDFWHFRHADDQLSGLFGSVALMAQRHDPRARCALRVYLGMNPRMVLLYATQAVPRPCIQDQLDHLLEDIPGGKATMLLFLTANYSWMEESWKKTIAHRCADALPTVIMNADPNQFSVLSNLLPYAVKSLGVNAEHEIVLYLERLVDNGEDELHEYLTGSGSLEYTAQQLKAVSVTGYNNPYKVAQLIRGHRQAHGWDDFSQRCAVVLGLVFKAYSLWEVLSEERGSLDASEITAMSSALQKNGLPLTEHLNLLGNFIEAVYFKQVIAAVESCVATLLLPTNQTQQLCHAAKNGNLFTRQQAIRALSRLSSEEAKEGILACTGDSAKAVQSLLLELLPEHPEWASEYIALLKSKKAAQRILAATVLGKLGNVGTAALQEALAAEKNAKAADAIQNALGASALPPVTGTEEICQRILKNNKIKKIQWLLENSLPVVRLAEKDRKAEDHMIQALLVSYCELGRIGKSDIAAQISAELNPRDLEKLADEVYERWIAAGAPSKQKWVMAFSAVYGGSTICKKLIRAINDWPQNARGAIACDGVKALTLSSAPEALLTVDAISRKFKFRQVRTAAAEALETAARELGITSEELADRIVPDLGFDNNGKRVFNYGKRSFTVRLTSTLELEITTEAGKPVKNLPAPGKTDEEETAKEAYEQFKIMKKQIRTTITTQKARLEAALAAMRCWNVDRWTALFVQNPVMHQFAISLIWGVYQEGKLTDTFRYMEDGSFNTVEEEEFELPENATIGLVHPVELGEALLSGWKQQLEDYEVTQSISQLDRPIFLLTAEQRDARTLETFGGKILNGLSLSGKLTGQGWYRGSVVDGGAFYTFWREDPALGMGVELRFSGSFIGDENENVTIYDAVFYKSGTVTRGSYNYDAPKEENIFSLGQIPARYFSEIMHQLTRATVSSTETHDNWRTDRHDL